jgi:SAM-dependent methyltransferase
MSSSELTSFPPGLTQSTYWEKVPTTEWGRYVTAVEKQTIDRGLTLVSQPGDAIEVGCEGGRWSKMLADQGWNMSCIDVDSKTLQQCQRKVPTARCIHASPTDRAIPCPSNFASLVLCIEVAPVIQSDWFLPEVQRVLVHGGVLVATFWNFLSWRGLLARMRFQLTRTPSASDFYRCSYIKWRPSVARNGLKLVHERGFYWSPFTRSSDSALVPRFVGVEEKLGLNNLPSISPWIAVIAQKPKEKTAPR